MIYTHIIAPHGHFKISFPEYAYYNLERFWKHRLPEYEMLPDRVTFSFLFWQRLSQD
jgi:hypothetical protein